MARIKTYDELTFTDDFMFCKVLENNEELCKGLIEIILDREIKIIKNVLRQKPIEITPDGRGVRLDVWMQGDDTIYDLEMQNVNKKDLPQRVRYTQAVIDLDMMERGAEFNTIKNSCIIFICSFDPFGLGMTKYSVKQTIAEAPEREYNDGTEKVFVSTLPGLAGEVSKDLLAVLEYLNGESPDSNFTRHLDNAVQRAKSQADWRKEYMLMEEKFRDLRKEGLEEGRIMGLKEGLEEGRAEGLKEGLEEGRAEGRAKGLKEGLEEGRTQGLAEGLAEGRANERRMMQELLHRLKADGRESSFLQAMEDDELMKSLYEEYGIAQE